MDLSEEDVEKIAKRASELVLDANPFQPLDEDQLAERIEQILRNRRDQEFGREVREQAVWAVRAALRALIVLVGIAAVWFFTWLTGWLKQ